MRHWLPISVVLCASTACAQEFTSHSNGLIYNARTMESLGYIVDSLNHRFSSCTNGRAFHGVHMGPALVLRAEGAHAGLEKALDEHIALEELESRFGITGKIDTVYMALMGYMSRGDSTTGLMRLDLTDGIDEAFDVKEPLSRVVARAGSDWFFEHWTYQERSTWHLVRFLERPNAAPLPPRYARLVEYVDCLVDTTGQVMTNGAEYMDEEQAPGPALKAWSERKSFARGLRNDPAFPELVRAAYDEVLVRGGGEEDLEEDVERYLGAKERLELMRRRRVVGFCSMDDSPRRHAMSIAVLAAETTSWPVFLRSHLNIMNDRFDRMSDGSYAWGRRATYLRELEELHINVPDLVIGSCLRVSDAAQGHYNGSAGRVGRALTETREPDVVEERMLSMIRDPELDLYNRTVIWYLYLNYCGHLTDKDDAHAQREQVMTAASSFPAPLARTASKK